MFRSIRTKLLLTYLALAMITVIIAGLLSFLLIIRNARIQERQYLHTVAKNLAGELEQQDLLPDRQQGKTGIPPRQGWRRYGDGMFMRMMTAPDFSPAQGSPETRLSPETKRQIQELADAAGYLHNIQVQLLTPDQKLILRSAQPPLPGRMQEMMRITQGRAQIFLTATRALNEGWGPMQRFRMNAGLAHPLAAEEIT